MVAQPLQQVFGPFSRSGSHPWRILVACTRDLIGQIPVAHELPDLVSRKWLYLQDIGSCEFHISVPLRPRAENKSAFRVSFNLLIHPVGHLAPLVNVSDFIETVQQDDAFTALHHAFEPASRGLQVAKVLLGKCPKRWRVFIRDRFYMVAQEQQDGYRRLAMIAMLPVGGVDQGDVL